MDDTEIEVRDLKAKDLRMMLKLFSKLSPQAKNGLATLLEGASKSGEPDLLALGTSMFQILSELTDDLYSWLSEMSGINVGDLDEMPIGTPIQILKQILSKPEVKDFFESAALKDTS